MHPRSMRTIYMTRTTEDLRTLRSKKITRLQLLDSWADTWFIKREREVLLAQIDAIGHELFVRSLSIEQKK